MIQDIYKSVVLTVDFDNTLTRLDVQEYIKELIGIDIDVWVLTMRYDELHKHKWKSSPTNQDLYDVLDKIGLPKHKVIFCNMEGWESGEHNAKAKYLRGTNVLLHLDDSERELMSFESCEGNNTVPVQVNKDTWRFDCSLVIANYINKRRDILWNQQSQEISQKK